jgi:hypothetical protein
MSANGIVSDRQVAGLFALENPADVDPQDRRVGQRFKWGETRASTARAVKPALAIIMSVSNGMEVIMTYESRLLAGIVLIVLPTVMFGGVSILSLLVGDPAYMENPCARICGAPDTRMRASGSSWRS